MAKKRVSATDRLTEVLTKEIMSVKMKSLSCVWLFCHPMDCSLQHSLSMARVLEWVAISFSRGSSQPRDQTWVFRIVGRRFTIWATREVTKWVRRWLKSYMELWNRRRGCHSFSFPAQSLIIHLLCGTPSFLTEYANLQSDWLICNLAKVLSLSLLEKSSWTTTNGYTMIFLFQLPIQETNITKH